MKKLVILLFTVLLSSYSIGQQFKQGKPIEDKSFNKEWSNPIGVVDGAIYFMDIEVNLYTKGKITFTKIDKDLNLEFRKKLDFKVPNYTDFSIHVFENKIYLFYTNPSLVSVSYEYQVFDLDGNALENGVINSLSIKGVAVGTNYNKFATSPNGEYVAVVVGARKSNSDFLTLNVMKLHLRDKVTVEKHETLINYEGYGVSSLGTISLSDDGHIFGLVNKKREVSDELEYDLDLFALDNASKLLKVQEVSANGYFFRNFYFKMNDDNELKLWGTYFSKKDKKYYLNGFFIANYDMQNLEFEDVNFKPLSGDILSIYGESDKNGEYKEFKGKFSVSNFDNEDGTGFLVAERLYTYYASIQYELLVMPYNGNNEMSDIVFVPKCQKYSSEFLGSGYYEGFTKNNELNLFFNANNDIINATNAIDNFEMISPIQDAKLFQVKVSLDGKKAISVFENNSVTKRYLMTSRSFNMDGYHVLPMNKKNKLIYGIYE
jgi:hypothetical protein